MAVRILLQEPHEGEDGRMNIAFKYFMIQAGGTPQPLIGTFMTAAVTTNTVQQSLNINGDPAPVTLTVNDSSMFRQGDFGLVTDPGTFFRNGFRSTINPRMQRRFR